MCMCVCCVYVCKIVAHDVMFVTNACFFVLFLHCLAPYFRMIDYVGWIIEAT